jgi:hypothetical protein
MSSLFKKPGTFGAKTGQDLIKGALGSGSSIYGKIGYIILYALIACIIVVIIMMLLGKKIDFSFLDFRSTYKRVMSQSIRFWKPTSQFTNLTTAADSIPGFQDRSYTTLIDCVLFNSRSYKTLFSGGDGPYRHIYHRGSNELYTNSVSGMALTGCGNSGNLDNMPKDGLPSSMNPGVFLDPNINDIIVFVDTDNNSRESVRITDIPLDKPFRIGIIVNKNVLEVYLNCRLEATKIMHNLPRDVENQWYGLAGPAAAQAQIKDLYVWTNPLMPIEMQPLCPKLPDFTVKRPICDGAEMPIPIHKEKPKEPSVILGMSKALSKCND